MKEFFSQITVKKKILGTTDQLDSEIESDIKEKVCRHVFNIQHQLCQMRRIKEQLSDKEILLNIDFSENYGTKHHTEMQSMDFGASHGQVILHTGFFITEMLRSQKLFHLVFVQFLILDAMMLLK